MNDVCVCGRVQHNREGDKIMARSIRIAAKLVRQLALDLAEEHGRNDPLVKLIFSDAKELRECAALLRQGKRQEAVEKVCSMNTGCRDNIPQDAWDYLVEEEA